MILALDIGGSFIKAAWSHAPGHLQLLDRIATPGNDFAAFTTILRNLVAASPARPSAIAISLTGVVDPDNQQLTCANIPALHQRRLGPELENLLGAPVLIANDADCFVLAEATEGAGRGHEIVFGLILGSGVGGGLVSGGRLINQSGGFAGEWGHGPVLPAFAGSPPRVIPAFDCGCGLKGCLNTVGAARGLEAVHHHLHGVTQDSLTILGEWEAGDPKGAETVDIVTDLLAQSLALAVNITGAAIAPVGGGLANSIKLLSKIDEKTKLRILRSFQRPLVVRAECGPDAGLIGAAALGWGVRE